MLPELTHLDPALTVHLIADFKQWTEDSSLFFSSLLSRFYIFLAWLRNLPETRLLRVNFSSLGSSRILDLGLNENDLPATQEASCSDAHLLPGFCRYLFIARSLIFLQPFPEHRQWAMWVPFLHLEPRGERRLVQWEVQPVCSSSAVHVEQRAQWRHLQVVAGQYTLNSSL